MFWLRSGVGEIPLKMLYKISRNVYMTSTKCSVLIMHYYSSCITSNNNYNYTVVAMATGHDEALCERQEGAL